MDCMGLAFFLKINDWSGLVVWDSRGTPLTNKSQTKKKGIARNQNHRAPNHQFNVNIAPENGWLEGENSFWDGPFFRGYVSVREGTWLNHPFDSDKILSTSSHRLPDFTEREDKFPEDTDQPPRAFLNNVTVESEG